MSVEGVVAIYAGCWIASFIFAAWAWHLHFRSVGWEAAFVAAVACGIAGPVIGLTWLFCHFRSLHVEWLERLAEEDA